MKRKAIIVLLSLIAVVAVLLAAPWRTPAGGWHCWKPRPCRLAGTWTYVVHQPFGEIYGTFTLSPQDSAGIRFTNVGQPLNTNPTILGYFDADLYSDHVGEVVRTGRHTFQSTVIGYGTRTPEESAFGKLVYISVATSTLRFAVDPETGKRDCNTLEVEGTHAIYLPEQDADGDLLPDEGQEPLFCAPFAHTAKRVSQLPLCVPPPPTP